MNKVKRFITNFKQRYETPWNTPKDTSCKDSRMLWIVIRYPGKIES